MDQTLQTVDTEAAEVPPPAVDPLMDQALEQSEPVIFGDSRIAKNLLELVQLFERSERFTRDRQVKKWRKQMLYWDSVQFIWWSDFASDWRTPEQTLEENPTADIDPALYAKVINIYRAHGEVIIAAMSAALPSVPFAPSDADNPDDVSTAKAYSALSSLIQKHNYAELLFMRALYILYNQGVVFGYNEHIEDKRFGSISIPQYKDHHVTTQERSCPNCGFTIGSDEISAVPLDEMQEPTDESVQPANNFPPEAQPPMDPSMDPAMGQEEMGPMETCPQCGSEISPDVQDFEEVLPRLSGYSTQPKSRECIEVYGPLNVKVSSRVLNLESTPILILETDEHFARLQDIYTEIADKIAPVVDLETVDRSMRQAASQGGELAIDLCTLRRCWIQPWYFNALGVVSRQEEIQELKSAYPDGAYVVIINNDLVAEGVPDMMGDHWTATEHPLGETIHTAAMGEPVIPIQDITNEVANLTVEAIEFGIPEVFADPSVLDFDAYGKSEARPGQVSPAKAAAGQNLSAGFYEIKTSSISQEVDKFRGWTEKMGQFVSGAIPSVFGGALAGGTGTAKEYEMSRSQALQRLQTTWKVVKVWWAKMLAKSVRSYALNMKEDERYAQKSGSSFLNVWIRRAELNGTVGDVEPEVNESFPTSWAQKRDVILQMIQLQNPMVDQVLGHPENSSLIASIVGVPELFIPGDDSRNKQLWEISQLITQEPQENPMAMVQQGPPNGEPNQPAPDGGESQGSPQPMAPPMTSSIPVDPEIDDHFVEAETGKAWLRSEAGLDMKQRNPGAYLNVLLHTKEHIFFASQQQAAMQAAQPSDDNKPPSKGAGE